MQPLEILTRIMVAAFLGGLVGFEREVHGCAAGLRTHILVSIGSALFMITSLGVAVGNPNFAQVDPSRIAAGVVTGIGFLGAGAIIRYGATIRGLTTAASIWAVSAIGLAAGTGMYMASLITTFTALAILILSKFEETLELKRYSRKVRVRVKITSATDVPDLKNVVEAYGGRIRKITTHKDDKNQIKEFEVDIMLSRIYNRDVIAEMSSLPDIVEVNWE